MGFRDDGEAARARADALERENRELRQQLARREQEGGSDEAAPRPPGGGRAAAYIVAGIAALVIGGALVGVFRAPVVILPVVGALGALLIIVGIVSSLLIVVAPNELVVLSGRQRRLPDGSVVSYRVVRGGRVLRMPILERADHLDLTNFALDIALSGLYAKGGATVSLEAAANVKIDGTMPGVANALERFLGRSRSEIASVARETLEGAIRGLAAALTPEELRSDSDRVAYELIKILEDDMRRLGLVLDTVKISVV